MRDSAHVNSRASILATLFFAPNYQRARILKNLYSADRNLAIDGVKNAAWDLTYLSALANMSEPKQTQSISFLFATADERLKEIGNYMYAAPAGDPMEQYRAHLASWWSSRDIDRIMDALEQCLMVVRQTKGLCCKVFDFPLRLGVSVGDQAMSDFKGRHFEGVIGLWVVRWYCRYGISYRDLEQMMAERGVTVDHTTI
jgi:hypothetical protein